MKRVLVTGAAKNLGAEMARHLSSAGYTVVIHYRRSEKEALALAQEVGGESIRGDFSSLKTTQMFIDELLSRFSDFYGVVNNVGDYLIGPALSTPPEEFLNLFQSHTLAPLALIQALAPSLKQSKGRVVNIGMVGCDTVRAAPHAAAYNLAKMGLAMLTRTLSAELSPHEVCVNMVSPGYLETSVELPDSLPMGRPVTLAEVASCVTYLMSPAARSLTGQCISLAGK
jgi:NAD(P)-dependent dehydrogenase (short-subunit alcohol dehydrogenase family)